jgi:hypothetical protein
VSPANKLDKPMHREGKVDVSVVKSKADAELRYSNIIPNHALNVEGVKEILDRIGITADDLGVSVTNEGKVRATNNSDLAVKQVSPPRQRIGSHGRSSG